MKSIVRFLSVLMIFGGWGLAALALHVVRTPDPSNAQQSKLVVIPKNELGLSDTYVDARGWTMSDVSDHRMLMLRVLYAEKADEFKFLADPKSKDDIATQLTDALSGPKAATERSATTARAAFGPGRH
ncbi:MAG: hypothetical protein ABSB33_02335 [Tepidisphaeraceae bacterium]